MSNPDKNFPKVLGLFYHRPLDLIGIPLTPVLLIRRVPYPIGCISGIVLSGLQGIQRWRVLGQGGNLDQSLGTGRFKKRTRM